MAVRIDDATVYEPDASVRCGPKLPEDAVQFSDPVMVVKVLSPSTRAGRRGQARGLFPLHSVRTT